ncbi:isoaspartyl peptidase/L-asparaginase family protein [Yunchengibacter salinarum]|uniref:isoaspartyl peptidase/L-asparaginase family protein n=1 Tax=Yunchengibacter salinarum TaxID=3133399 RepID=UPI0035B63945
MQAGYRLVTGLFALTALAFWQPESGAAMAGHDTLATPEERPAYALALHGGAGTITPDKLTPETEAAIRAKLGEALAAGEAVLSGGGSAVDAVIATITVLEDSAHFNAGRGAVFTHDGHNEMDTALMDGKTLNAGAAAGVRTVKNPIRLARAIMDHSAHVMLSGAGADRFAADQGLETAEPGYFRTERRWRQLQNALAEGKGAVLDHDGAPGEGPNGEPHKFGTVGAVALDRQGNVAAGTSTGGMTNKKYGRIGDSPIIGAGTYASNESCAVSATGHGEFFIRKTVARDVCAMMEYGGMSLSEAAERLVLKDLMDMGGDGGIIALDPKGSITLTFNSAGMYRAAVRAGEAPVIGIYEKMAPSGRDDDPAG